MSRSAIVVMVLVLASVTAGVTGCAQERGTSSAIPTLAIQGTAAFRFYGPTQRGLGNGTYTVAVADSNFAAIRGRVFLKEGASLGRTDGEQNSPLLSGLILVMCVGPTQTQSSQYCEPGGVWQSKAAPILEALDAFGTVSVAYYAAGYASVRFENVPVQKGKAIILPDITLVPANDYWVFYPE